MKIKLKLILFFAIAISASCSRPMNFDLGKTKNGIYSNHFFNFEITIPETWIGITQEELQATMETGKKLAAGDNENLKAALNATDVTVASLFGYSKYEKGAPVDFNPSIMMICENIKAAPGVKNGSDYLFQARKAMSLSAVKYDRMDSVYKKVQIGGADFYVMNAEMHFSTVDVKQKYFAYTTNGFCLLAILTYDKEENLSELERCMHTFYVTGKK
jgi:hypothetical protein